MKKILFVGLLLASCSTTTQNDIAAGVAAGKKYCSMASALGPIVVQIISSADPKAAGALNTAGVIVADSCAAVNAVPTAAPPPT